MLDQNTDRMWYVIGAVIVGAALIFLVNSSFPQLFASVGTTFEDKIEEVSNEIATLDINQNLLGSHTLQFRNDALNKKLDTSTDIWSFDVEPVDNFSGNIWTFRLAENNTVITKYNLSFEISYDLYLSESALVVNDINNYPLDNANKVINPSWSSNDHDDVGKREMNGIKTTQVATNIPSKKWTTMTVKYANSAKANVNKVALGDETLVGFVSKTGKPLHVQIRNIRGVKGGL